MVNTSLSGLALSILPERDNGLASGIHDMFRQGGIAVGVAGLGALIPAAAGLGADAPAFVDGLQDALLVGARRGRGRRGRRVAADQGGADARRRRGDRAGRARPRRRLDEVEGLVAGSATGSSHVGHHHVGLEGGAAALVAQRVAVAGARAPVGQQPQRAGQLRARRR